MGVPGSLAMAGETAEEASTSRFSRPEGPDAPVSAIEPSNTPEEPTAESSLESDDSPPPG